MEKNVWAYRLLVSHENVSLWELKSIKGLVCQDDLYTIFSGDNETDEFERFITSIEEPGQAAIDKLLAHAKLKPADRQASRNSSLPSSSARRSPSSSTPDAPSATLKRRCKP